MTLKTVFIVRASISGASRMVDRERLDDTTDKVTWELDRPTRVKLGNVWSKHRSRITRDCISFYGLQVTKEDKIGGITKAVEEADVALQAIAPSVKANVHYIPLPVDARARGEVYDAMVNAIRGQVLRVLDERLQALAKLPSVPKRSRMALLDLCDRLKEWNVLEDEDIAKTIEEYRRQFEADVIEPVAAEIRKELAAATGEGAYIEI